MKPIVLHGSDSYKTSKCASEGKLLLAMTSAMAFFRIAASGLRSCFCTAICGCSTLGGILRSCLYSRADCLGSLGSSGRITGGIPIIVTHAASVIYPLIIRGGTGAACICAITVLAASALAGIGGGYSCIAAAGSINRIRHTPISTSDISASSAIAAIIIPSTHDLISFIFSGCTVLYGTERQSVRFTLSQSCHRLILEIS